MHVTIGTAPDSWGVWFPDDPKQTPWQRCLDEIAAAGYEWTELGPYGYLPTDLDTLRRELDQRQLKVAGTVAMGPLHDPAAWPDLDRQVRGACESLTALGARYLVLIDGLYTDEATGKPLMSPTLDDDDWKRLIDKAQGIGALAAGIYDIRTVLHPHTDTHIEYEHQIERFLADTDPAAIGLCLDVGHHAYRGGDAIAFYRRHQRRIEYLHLKSVDADKQRDVEARGLPFAQGVAEGVFCEPSQGAVDFGALLEALRETDYEGFGIVEQDMYPCPFEQPLPIARRTRQYLREIGMG